MLVKIFSGNSVTVDRRFAGKRDIFFEDLMGVAGNPEIGAAAGEGLSPLWTSLLR